MIELYQIDEFAKRAESYYLRKRYAQPPPNDLNFKLYLFNYIELKYIFKIFMNLMILHYFKHNGPFWIIIVKFKFNFEKLMRKISTEISFAKIGN